MTRNHPLMSSITGAPVAPYLSSRLSNLQPHPQRMSAAAAKTFAFKHAARKGIVALIARMLTAGGIRLWKTIMWRDAVFVVACNDEV